MNRNSPSFDDSSAAPTMRATAPRSRAIPKARAGLPAGSEVVFQVEVEPHRGGREIIEVPLTLPEHLAPGPFRVVAASAAELFAVEAQRAAGRFQGPSLENTVTLLRT